MSDRRSVWARLTATTAPGATVWIRLFVGAVFLSEGIQKFLFPDRLGIGRFDKAGIPAGGLFATLDGVAEIACGVAILAGFLTRLAAIPMVIDMLGALFITKVPILWGASPLFFKEAGWWDFAHEARVDVAQLCGTVFLLIVGAGRYSIDARLHAAVPAGAHADALVQGRSL
ncbi:DoxX family protein [Microbispora sp. NBC_01189]|uniref:DoxX family protein n=1 Tax=Microbispora sp. NBC_01189 TaxID=2903583 RepID=UPI002E12D218|nr:DoxX family protein [Microbispora sp. NBC_01189]